MLKIEKNIMDVSIVSFDIFDTLVARTYRRPTDLFAHLEESERVPGFKNTRIDAEMSVRRQAAEKGQHEVTLQDIYEEMHASYKPLMEKEIALEIAACHVNPEMLQVFNYAKQIGKRIVIASDMYLPAHVIESILHNCGYEGYEKLFVSSDTLRTKASGAMYEDIIGYCNAPAKDILHIGDHGFTDIQVAREHGLNAYHYEPIREKYGNILNSSYFAVLNQYADSSPFASILQGLTVLHRANNPDESYWTNFGYQYVGPIAYGYAQWLWERFQQCGIEKAYFMQRDGYIFQKVFNALHPDFETHEIYGSRRLFLFAGMKQFGDIKEVLTDLYAKGLSYGQLWDWIGLTGEELKAKYCEEFPDQEQLVVSNEAFEKINSFLLENTKLLELMGQAERKIILAYLNKIGLPDGNVAVVDLGWKGSMLKSLTNLCNLCGLQTNMIGYYLGTHQCQSPNLRLESYLLDHGVGTGAKNANVLLNYGYIIPILELIFSAPHGSILRLEQTGEEFTPVFQSVNSYEQTRIEVCKQVTEGVLAFVSDIQQIHSAAKISVSKEVVLAPLEYMANHITAYDQNEIERIYCCYGRGNNSCYRPIEKTGVPVIGIVNPWPGDESAEAEVLTRIQRAAKENDIGYVMMDNFGHLLDSNQRATKELVDPERLSFVITTHYETPKILNAFYYHTLWNPPEIPLNLDYYTDRVTNQYIMNDDFLIYDTGGMSNHLRSMLMNCPRTLKGASMLTASFPVSAVLAPNLKNPTMFYCGMNWERVVHGTNRHEGLFKLLDQTGKVKFFGPEQVKAWGGLRPWDGYQCYQYSIPFDGFSILKEINQCGVCLVLSSDIHRRAGSATNRTYEACAAGAVIISDDNSFMLEHFGDAALFINYNKNNPEDTFRQIMEKYDWIVTHPDEALALAKRAQEIFLQKFTLDMQLNQIIEHHPVRKLQIAADLYARDNTKRVLVTYVVNTLDINRARQNLSRIFKNIHGQQYRNIRLSVCVDTSIANSVTEYCQMNCAGAQVIPMALFDFKGSRNLTDGQAMHRALQSGEFDYFLNTTATESWFFDHITTLVRSIEDTNSAYSYCGTAFEDINQFTHVCSFDVLNRSALFDFTAKERRFLPGQFLFNAHAYEMIPEYLYDFLDGWEHICFASLLRYRYHQTGSFSRRMTLRFTEEDWDLHCTVIPEEMQKRFIQDLVRFELPEQATVMAPMTDTAAGSHVNPQAVGDMILKIPLQYWIKLRWYRFCMRKVRLGSERYKKIEKKHNALLDTYNRYWGN